jgi:hypothetical protein
LEAAVTDPNLATSPPAGEPLPVDPPAPTDPAAGDAAPADPPAAPVPVPDSPPPGPSPVPPLSPDQVASATKHAAAHGLSVTTTDTVVTTETVTVDVEETGDDGTEATS